MHGPGGSRSLSLTLVADDRDSCALLLSVRSVLGFAFVSDAIFATKDTKYLFDQTICPVRDQVIIIDELHGAAIHGALNLHRLKFFQGVFVRHFSYELLLAVFIQTNSFLLQVFCDAAFAVKLTAWFTNYRLVGDTVATFTN